MWPLVGMWEWEWGRGRGVGEEGEVLECVGREGVGESVFLELVFFLCVDDQIVPLIV